MEVRHKSACRDYSPRRVGKEKASYSSRYFSQTVLSVRYLTGREDGKVSWPPFMAGCLPINSCLLTEESVTKPNVAPHTIHSSLIKVRLHFSPPPWFWAYITKALRETFRAVYSELMTASCGKDKVTEGDWSLHCMLHRLITVLVWSVDNICNSNVAEINKIICIKIQWGFCLTERCFTYVITFLATI